MSETLLRGDAQQIINILNNLTGKAGVTAQVDHLFDQDKKAMVELANKENRDPNQKGNSPLLKLYARKLLQMTILRNALPTLQSAKKSWFDDLGST